MEIKNIIIFILVLSNIMALGVGYSIGNMVGYFQMSYDVAASNEMQEIKDHVNYVFNITESINFHKNHGKLATITAASPPGRFGALDLDQNQVLRFKEKPKGDGDMINAGFFVLSPKVIDYIDDASVAWEQFPLIQLANERELMAYQHKGFWHPMDTLRDKVYLEELWNAGKAPWKVWN